MTKKIRVTDSGGGPDGDDNRAQTAVMTMMTTGPDTSLDRSLPALGGGFSFWLGSLSLNFPRVRVFPFHLLRGSGGIIKTVFEFISSAGRGPALMGMMEITLGRAPTASLPCPSRHRICSSERVPRGWFRS